GKNLYITGTGRCNLTNACDFETFMRNVVNNDKFLMSAISEFLPEDTMQLFEKENLPLKVERGNRVFPSSDKSSDVIKTISKMLERDKVEVRFNETVEKILVDNGVIRGLLTNKGEYFCDKVIVATGGFSYRATGSTGDGYKFARELGHKIIEPRQALVPIETIGGFAELSGLTLKNVTLKTVYEGKTVCSEFGELLFTHTGVSGPIVLTTSSKINRLDFKKILMYIDLKPALDHDTLDSRVLKDLKKYTKKQLKNAMGDLLPSSMIPFVIKASKVDGDKRTDDISKAERRSLVETLKNFPINAKCLASFDEAIITSGGVCVKEVNPVTMESKIVKGLFFAGEVLDVDALTGGFNLQIAFATGYKAGSAHHD
ncbi:MAG: aminoacetone oxidase family FAD-binding enzyme, partial [Clostridia bacterium]|nr:aminoacetone oxidase family FAD-binding enzyme [Clostridia bacterium]